MRGIEWNKRSKFVKNGDARYGVRVIYTSKGMSKKFGVRVIHRCALSTGKYGIYLQQHKQR
jgi:hypothetical protein